MLTGAQVFYIANCYPEKLSNKEAEEFDGWKIMNESGQSYWNVAAKVITEMVKEE